MERTDFTSVPASLSECTFAQLKRNSRYRAQIGHFSYETGLKARIFNAGVAYSKLCIKGVVKEHLASVKFAARFKIV